MCIRDRGFTGSVSLDLETGVNLLFPSAGDGIIGESGAHLGCVVRSLHLVLSNAANKQGS
eukprot:9330635-Prorocentrum_lima.AAC.1